MHRGHKLRTDARGGTCLGKRFDGRETRVADHAAARRASSGDWGAPRTSRATLLAGHTRHLNGRWTRRRSHRESDDHDEELRRASKGRGGEEGKMARQTSRASSCARTAMR